MARKKAEVVGSEAETLRKIGCAIGCIAITVIFVVLGPGLLFGLMLWSASERTVYSRKLSLDHSREARVQFDDCGAPCGWAKVVLIKRAWLPSDTPLLSCGAFLGEGTNNVRLEWEGNSRLIVHHGFDSGDLVVAKTCGPVSIIDQFDPALISNEP